MEQGKLARVRALIEEELGEFFYFSHLPGDAVETMAARLTRAVAPYLAKDESPAARSNAA